MSEEPNTPIAVSTVTLGPPRKRTITWYDPASTVELGRQLHGRDYLLAMKDGQLPEPPIVRLAGIEAIRIDHGDTLHRCRPTSRSSTPSA